MLACRTAPTLALVVLALGCSSSTPSTTTDMTAVVVDIAMPPDATVPPDLTAPPPRDFAMSVDGGVDPRFCKLPGSYQFTANGVVKIPGAPMNAADLSYLKLPQGFCAHWFAHIGNARQLRFAPSGELFVASPTRGTTGGGAGGLSAIVVLADDDHDGVADKQLTFIDNIAATQGIAFTPGFFYFQDGTKIFKVPYAVGDRVPGGARQLVTDITVYVSGLHWPKPIDIADDGTIYVGNGGDQGEMCDPLLAPGARPFHGGILKLDGTPGGKQVAKGLRNPIALRCSRGHDRCFALELALDYSGGAGGREKLLPIHDGDDWGYPCCATKDLPYSGIMPAPDCSGVEPESDAFPIADTPFGIDFETGRWPAPFSGNAFVALHGAFSTWQGLRVVAIKMGKDGLPLPNVDGNGMPTGAMVDFATGWPLGTTVPNWGRPASVEFAQDGRMFIGNDVTGDIIWIAPIGM
jgi:glucose/arabinose dehydrogenase